MKCSRIVPIGDAERPQPFDQPPSSNRPSQEPEYHRADAQHADEAGRGSIPELEYTDDDFTFEVGLYSERHVMKIVLPQATRVRNRNGDGSRDRDPEKPSRGRIGIPSEKLDNCVADILFGWRGPSHHRRAIIGRCDRSSYGCTSEWPDSTHVFVLGRTRFGGYGFTENFVG